MTCEDYLVSHRKFEIVTCSICGLGLTQNVPTPEHIGAYYMKGAVRRGYGFAATGLGQKRMRSTESLQPRAYTNESLEVPRRSPTWRGNAL